MNTSLLLLAVLGAHRLWNYEDIFSTPRRLLGWVPYTKPLTCAVCNPFWIAVALGSLSLVDHPMVFVLFIGLASYLPARLAVWIYLHLAPKIPGLLTKARERPIIPALPLQPGTTPPPGCSSCEEKKTALVETQAKAQEYTKRIVIMTALTDFNPSYSLTSVILDHARMFSDNKKQLIQIWVMQTCKDIPADLPNNVEVRAIIPAVPFKEDVVDEKGAELLKNAILRELLALGSADIFTHDLLFQSWFVTFAKAIHEIGGVPHFRWWHIAHSAPSPQARPLNLQNNPAFYRYILPEGHRLICLNEALKKGFAEHYFCFADRIDVIPNVRDPRTLWPCAPRLSQFISAWSLATVDIVQVYPVSSTRLREKGVHHLIRTFAELKKQGRTVRLVIVNPHANGAEAKKIIRELLELANDTGLKVEDYCFTSHVFPDMATTGLPSAWVQMLFQFSNLFLFPTISEASSLVLGEAILAGAFPIVNGNVPPLKNTEFRTWDWLLNHDEPPTETDARGVAGKVKEALHSEWHGAYKRRLLQAQSLDAVRPLLVKLLE